MKRRFIYVSEEHLETIMDEVKERKVTRAVILYDCYHHYFKRHKDDKIEKLIRKKGIRKKFIEVRIDDEMFSKIEKIVDDKKINMNSFTEYALNKYFDFRKTMGKIAYLG